MSVASPSARWLLRARSAIKRVAVIRRGNNFIFNQQRHTSNLSMGLPSLSHTTGCISSVLLKWWRAEQAKTTTVPSFTTSSRGPSIIVRPAGTNGMSDCCCSLTTSSTSCFISGFAFTEQTYFPVSSARRSIMTRPHLVWSPYGRSDDIRTSEVKSNGPWVSICKSLILIHVTWEETRKSLIEAKRYFKSLHTRLEPKLWTTQDSMTVWPTVPSIKFGDLPNLVRPSSWKSSSALSGLLRYWCFSGTSGVERENRSCHLLLIVIQLGSNI